MNSVSIFVDTWGWAALGHRRDPHHERVEQVFERFHAESVPLVTSDYVLDELITLLYRREVVREATRFAETLFSAVERGELVVVRVTAERFQSAWLLRKRFRDKPRISFTDLTSMAIMKEQGIRQVLTDDDHFVQVGLGFQKLP
jgi:predicted nucleic acid-binding protein